MTVWNEKGRKSNHAGYHSFIHKPRGPCPRRARTWQAPVLERGPWIPMRRKAQGVLHVHYLLAIRENHNSVKHIMYEKYRDEHPWPSTCCDCIYVDIRFRLMSQNEAVRHDAHGDPGGVSLHIVNHNK